MTEENLGESLYNLLAELWNCRQNRKVLDSIRGEYGVLRYLAYVEDQVSAGRLTEQLHVVPGRMTDILNSLENKDLVERRADHVDRRRVQVCITPQRQNTGQETQGRDQQGVPGDVSGPGKRRYAGADPSFEDRTGISGR